jgi:hypothetical protein
MTSVDKLGEVGPMGYRSHANPESSDKGPSECLTKESSVNDFNLYKKTSIRDDPVAIDLDIIQSQGPGNYFLNNTYGCGCELKDVRDVQLSQVTVNFNGGAGWIGEKGCLVDTDTTLRQDYNRITNKNYIHQLVERDHLTTGDLTKGFYDVDTESVIRAGNISSDDKACNSLSGVTIGNYFTPMIPKLRDEVQNLEHIIPENSMDSWVRGGLPTRQIQRNADYLRRCQEKTYEVGN